MRPGMARSAGADERSIAFMMILTSLLSGILENFFFIGGLSLLICHLPHSATRTTTTVIGY